MSKAVLLGIHPEWCEEIVLKKKTMEVRKNRPTLDVPFKVYIYCTKAPKGWMRAVPGHGWQQLDGKVIGEFICDKIERVGIPYPAYQGELDKRFIEESRASYYALHRYAFHDDLFFWHISNLKIYNCPQPFHDFTRLRKTKFGYEPVKIERPPQSWFYVEEMRHDPQMDP